MQSRYNTGVTDIKGVIDQENTTGSQYSFLQTFAEMWGATSPTQHHKYAIIDASYSEKQPVVITGSHNWSNSAENDNDENTLIIFDPMIANQYLQEFKKRYNEAGGNSNIFVPVELVSFTGSLLNGNVKLSWTTSTELNNFGFEVQRSYDRINFSSAGFINGAGNTTNIQNYTFIDYIEPAGHSRIYYRLKQVDFNGTSEYSEIVEVNIFKSFDYNLLQNYPNPFNPTTNITFEIPVALPVVLKIFDIAGQEIVTLVNEVRQPGSHTVKFDASGFASGMYIYRLTAGDYLAVKKMSIIK